MCFPKPSFLFLALSIPLLPALAAAQAPAPAFPMPVIHGSGSCEICHAVAKEDRLSSPAIEFKTDRHAEAGLGCADCHGGDPAKNLQEEAHAKSAGYIGVPQPQDIPDLCGRCHNNPVYMRTQNPSLPVDQEEKYWTSKHGQLLKMGLRKVAQCAACHTAHRVRPPTDPASTTYPMNVPHTCARCHAEPLYMAGFPIPTDQFAKFKTSVHGVALLVKEDTGAPACNNCHGNHGAVPPGAESLAHVCGLCHSLNAELFEKSPHAQAFAIQELPQCVVCHGYHDIAKPTAEMYDMRADSPCVRCHRPDDPGWRAGKKMHSLVTDVRKSRDRAAAALDAAQGLGMDVADGRFELQAFTKSYLQLRTLGHSVDLKTFEQKAAEALKKADAALAVASQATQEYHIRRKGLLISLLLSVPVIILMIARIRQIDKKSRR